MSYRLRKSKIEDFERCIEIRGKTRDNAIPAETLREIGVTKESWSSQVLSNRIVGVVAEVNKEVVGFCNGDSKTGEILVLAVLPEFEGKSIAKNMLLEVTQQLYSIGFNKLWLGASSDPNIRAHGFYRHLGWVPTGELDIHGDEVLEYKKT